MPNHLFDQIRAAIPAPAASFIAPPGEPAFAYGDMLAASARLAHVLVAQGVRPGDRVTAQVEKSPQAIFLYLAYLWLTGGWEQPFSWLGFNYSVLTGICVWMSM